MIDQPKTLEEAVEIALSKVRNVEQERKINEDDFVAGNHNGLGQWLRNNLYLWWHPGHGYSSWPERKPVLVSFFQSIGIVHADDMSSIILTTLHRKLNDKPVDIEGQVAGYHEFWKSQGHADGIPTMG